MQISALSSRGQFTIPKEIRDALSLREGDQLRVEQEGCRIYIERAETDEDAIWRWCGAHPFDYEGLEPEEWLRQMRGHEPGDIALCSLDVEKK